jgi:dihydrofolate reductase
MGVPYLSNRVIWVMMRNNTYGWLQMGYPQGGHANMVNIVTRVEDLPDGDYFVAGGASIYTAFMPHISEFYVTYLKHDYEGDTVMPAFEEPFKQEEVIFENDNMTIKRLYNRQDVLNISVP